MAPGAFTLLLLFTAQAQDPQVSIRGSVTNVATGEGLRKAYLRLASIGKGSQYPVVTNDQGVFAIANIAPGDYRLDAECTGFLDTWYGGGADPDDAVELRLSSGDNLTGVEIKNDVAGGSVRPVLDQDGAPWLRLKCLPPPGLQIVDVASCHRRLIKPCGEHSPPRRSHQNADPGDETPQPRPPNRRP
ncbi:MAG TPA: carboxypeptidase-like regulatory domain-containing protein [Bryobacteraceae bacterium]